MSHPAGRLRAILLTLATGSLIAGVATLPPTVQAAVHHTPPGAAAATPSTGTRPFKPGSYWNTKLGNAPLDAHSSAWINDAEAHSGTHLTLVLGAWGMPVYRSSASDPLVQISSGGHTVRFHIPAGARPMAANDAALTVIDPTTNQVVGLFGAHVSGGKWSVSGLSRYRYSSKGIAGGLPGGIKANFGHRGIPASVPAVTLAEIRRGRIRHRLEIYWHETASRTPEGASAYFPMTGSESGKTGVVPEGAVIRIKPGLNLDALRLSPAAKVIARALQKYGAVVGDNAGSGNSLKLQGNANWSGVLNKDSLKSIPWSDFVFVKGGFRP
ncbi:hypothetical protein [Nocardioides cynanchi]|uniref:hypothetical protein n=1 Tax=Nocardioides cynanchi TaxID=2558918 RepID=UPI001245071F|nr:hypothetical protein [Nocardioides cynanchi]